MLAVIIALALTSLPDEAEEQCARGRCRGTRVGGRSPAHHYALFEFAPESGAGMGTACACTTPTGAKGEAMTFTRASSATCLKGNTTTGIANGDMVTCSTGQPRVMPGGDGSGGLGLLVEGVRSNICVRSQEFDNAAWSKLGSGVAAPTVTADQAVAPDGTTTADRVQFNATVGAQYSVVSQSTGAGAYAATVFAKGVSGSGSLTLDCHNGGADSCVSCSYNSTSWTRCACTAAAGTPNFIIGPNSAGCFGGAADAADDVYLWGGQIEAAGAVFPTSYIATTSAPVARSEDYAYVDVNFPMESTWSQAVTWVSPTGWDVTYAGFLMEPSAATPAGNRYSVYNETNVILTQYSVVGSVLYKTQRSGLVLGTQQRFAGFYDGTNQSACVDGACSTSAPSYTALSPIIRIAIGNYGGGGGSPAWGTVKRLCFDRLLTRCR